MTMLRDQMTDEAPQTPRPVRRLRVFAVVLAYTFAITVAVFVVGLAIESIRGKVDVGSKHHRDTARASMELIRRFEQPSAAVGVGLRAFDDSDLDTILDELDLKDHWGTQYWWRVVECGDTYTRRAAGTRVYDVTTEFGSAGPDRIIGTQDDICFILEFACASNAHDNPDLDD